LRLCDFAVSLEEARGLSPVSCQTVLEHEREFHLVFEDSLQIARWESARRQIGQV
jgi:hypothetical protein